MGTPRATLEVATSKLYKTNMVKERKQKQNSQHVSEDTNKAKNSLNSNESNKEESEENPVKENKEDKKNNKLFKKENSETAEKMKPEAAEKGNNKSPKKEQKPDKKEAELDKEESKPSNEDKEEDTEEKKPKINPAMGRTRGPHPPSPSGNEVLKLTSDLPKEGYLARNPTGYIFLDLDDNWIFSVRFEMEKFGYEIPPYFLGAQAVGAHISVVPADIANKYKYKKEDVEIGKKIEFKVVRAGPSFPTRRWYGAEAVYKIWVKSAELDKVCMETAGPEYKPPGGFNIVVGVRRIEKRDEMMKEMVVKKEEKRDEMIKEMVIKKEEKD